MSCARRRLPLEVTVHGCVINVPPDTKTDTSYYKLVNYSRPILMSADYNFLTFHGTPIYQVSNCKENTVIKNSAKFYTQMIV